MCLVAAYFGLDTKEYPKSWFINAKISENFECKLKSTLKLNQVYQEKNGRKKVGFLKRILLVGFSGTAGIHVEDE